MTDRKMIYLDDAIKAVGVNTWAGHRLNALPSAQPYSLDEWCHNCKEYDTERHCCPRYNRVIRDADFLFRGIMLIRLSITLRIISSAQTAVQI